MTERRHPKTLFETLAEFFIENRRQVSFTTVKNLQSKIVFRPENMSTALSIAQWAIENDVDDMSIKDIKNIAKDISKL